MATLHDDNWMMVSPAHEDADPDLLASELDQKKSTTRLLRSSMRSLTDGIRVNLSRRTHVDSPRRPSATRGSSARLSLERMPRTPPQSYALSATTSSKKKKAEKSASSAELAMPTSDSSTWHRSGNASFARSLKKRRAMYSITFFPWKMEQHSFYSNPDAAAKWVPDTASSRCQICMISFNLTRRRHHCRLCGQLACNDCSMTRTLFPFSTKDQSHHLLKNNTAQRTCSKCAGTLKNMAAQRDIRVERLPDSKAGGFPYTYRSDKKSKGAPVSPCLELLSSFSSTTSTSASRVGELNEVLQARAISRRNAKGTFYVIDAKWLKQWLRYVRVEPSKGVSLDTSVTGLSSSQMSSIEMAGVDDCRPGPVSNYALLNFYNGKLVPKEGLVQGIGNQEEDDGDYRVISQAVWFIFHRIYGGGPSIMLKEVSSNQYTSGMYTRLTVGENGRSGTYNWFIVELDDELSSRAIDRPEAVEVKGVTPNMRKALRKPDEESTRQQDVRQISQGCAAPYQRLTSERGPATFTKAQVGFRSRLRKTFSGGWRKSWHHQPTRSRDSVSSSVVEVQEGAILYDGPSSNSKTVKSSTVEAVGPDDAKAVVTAFAMAAAKARKSSVASLSRHSSVASCSGRSSSVKSLT